MLSKIIPWGPKTTSFPPALKLMRVNLIIEFIWPKKLLQKGTFVPNFEETGQNLRILDHTYISFKNLSKRVPGVRIDANLMASNPNLLQGIFNDPKEIRIFTHNLQRSSLSAGVFGSSIGSPTPSSVQEQPVTSRI